MDQPLFEYQLWQTFLSVFIEHKKAQQDEHARQMKLNMPAGRSIR